MLALFLSAALARLNAIEIRDVAVVDVRSGKIRSHPSVLIDGDSIEEISPTNKLKRAATQDIDAKGKYLIPGLWDMHIHFFLPDRYWALFTANGVTGGRVMFGGKPFFKENSDFESGAKTGPLLYIGSPIVDGPIPIWPGSVKVQNPAQGREEVRRLKKEGYAFIKVYSALPRESYLAIADECNQQRIPFEGHLPMGVTLNEAADLGQRTVEHMLGTTLAFAKDRDGLENDLRAAASKEDYASYSKKIQETTRKAVSGFSPTAGKDLIKLLLKNHTYLCPTLTVLNSTSHLDDLNLAKDPRNAYMPTFLTASWDPSKDFRFKARTADSWDWARRTYNEELQITGILAKAGVPLLAGTDCMNPYCYPGFSLHDELVLLVQAGLTNLQALQSATSNAADFMERRNIGEVKVGAKSDLVLLDANPLENISNTTKIFMVVNHGKTLDRSALDLLLENARRSSAKPGSTPPGFVGEE